MLNKKLIWTRETKKQTKLRHPILRSGHNATVNEVEGHLPDTAGRVLLTRKHDQGRSRHPSVNADISSDSEF
jgi:hypothetical protein